MKRSKSRIGKKKNRFCHESLQQRADRIARTGIATAGDLKKEYDLGYQAAIRSSEEYLVPFFFAALSCALKSTYKFGEERILRTVAATIRTMNEEISVQDMLERCKRETGLDILRYYKENPLGEEGDGT